MITTVLMKSRPFVAADRADTADKFIMVFLYMGV